MSGPSSEEWSDLQAVWEPEIGGMTELSAELLASVTDFSNEHSSASIQHPNSAESLLSARPGAAAAWLHKVLNRHQHAFDVVDGWQVMDMKLEGDRGGVTIKTRREDDRVSVSVSFTDPMLAAQMQANVQRIEQVLQNQYEASVSLSFESGGENEASAQREPQRDAGTPGDRPASASPERRERGEARSRAQGAAREWVV